MNDPVGHQAIINEWCADLSETIAEVASMESQDYSERLEFHSSLRDLLSRLLAAEAYEHRDSALYMTACTTSAMLGFLVASRYDDEAEAAAHVLRFLIDMKEAMVNAVITHHRAAKAVKH